MTCEEALEKAIVCLKQYASEDDDAGLNGSGCYNNPNAVVNEWIEAIRKVQKES
jgi:hypothetical protein